MEKNLTVLLDRVSEVNADLLLDWLSCFDGDSNADQLEKAKQEIRDTVNRNAENVTDQSTNFVMKLASGEANGYRDRNGVCRKKDDLALLFMHLMNDSIGGDYWKLARKAIVSDFEKQKLEIVPLIRKATHSHLNFRQLKMKYQPKDTSRITSLHESARLENVQRVKELVKDGALTPETADSYNNRTALHYAAMAINPNAEIAAVLVTEFKRIGHLEAINKQGCRETGWNTALHIAAGNVNVTQAFIDQLTDADPTRINCEFDTPFHVAAKSKNPKAILYLLNTFAPTKHGWDVDDVDDCKDPETEDDVLDICARSGNSKAVAMLIQHGADITKGVLHEIVIESVRSPENVRQLKDVYQVIVENVVTWRCLEEKRVILIRDSREYSDMLEETMIWLVTRPLKRYHNEDVLQCAISHGASEMFRHIIATPNVFTTWVFEDDFARVNFDVTNFTKELMNDVRRTSSTEGERVELLSINSEDNDYRRRPQRNFEAPQTPGTPYLTHLLSCFDRWKTSNILCTQPLKQLTEPYFTFMQRLYVLIGLLQLTFMVLFSVYYLPDTCSLSAMFNINNTHCTTHNDSLLDTDDNTRESSIISERRPYPSVLWLIWPIFVFVGIAVVYYCTVERAFNVSFTEVNTNSKIVNTVIKCSSLATKLCRFLLLLQSILSKIFCLTVFVWFYKCGRSETHESYVEITAMVLLFGWTANLEIVGAVNKNFSISALLVQEIIAKDLPFFILFFVFTVAGFSFAMHALRMATCEVNLSLNLWDTFYGVLSSGFGIGDFFENTIIPSRSCVGEGSEHMLEAVYFAYVGATLIILMNVLIAMMNNRYKITKKRAENMWRYRILSTMSALESDKYIGRLMQRCRLPALCRPLWGYRNLWKFLLCYFGCCIHGMQAQDIVERTRGENKRYILVLSLKWDE